MTLGIIIGILLLFGAVVLFVLLSTGVVNLDSKPAKAAAYSISLFAGLASIIALFDVQFIQGRNHVPEISGLTAAQQILKPGESTILITSAYDEDGDPLVFVWSANRGQLKSGSQGPRIEYTAPIDPGAGIDHVRVTVSDGQGGTTQEELTLIIEQ